MLPANFVHVQHHGGDFHAAKRVLDFDCLFADRSERPAAVLHVVDRDYVPRSVQQDGVVDSDHVIQCFKRVFHACDDFAIAILRSGVHSGRQFPRRSFLPLHPPFQLAHSCRDRRLRNLARSPGRRLRQIPPELARAAGLPGRSADARGLACLQPDPERGRVRVYTWRSGSCPTNRLWGDPGRQSPRPCSRERLWAARFRIFAGPRAGRLRGRTGPRAWFFRVPDGAMYKTSTRRAAA